MQAFRIAQRPQAGSRELERLELELAALRVEARDLGPGALQSGDDFASRLRAELAAVELDAPLDPRGPVDAERPAARDAELARDVQVQLARLQLASVELADERGQVLEQRLAVQPTDAQREIHARRARPGSQREVALERVAQAREARARRELQRRQLVGLRSDHGQRLAIAEAGGEDERLGARTEALVAHFQSRDLEREASDRHARQRTEVGGQASRLRRDIRRRRLPRCNRHDAHAERLDGAVRLSGECDIDSLDGHLAQRIHARERIGSLDVDARPAERGETTLAIEERDLFDQRARREAARGMRGRTQAHLRVRVAARERAFKSRGQVRRERAGAQAAGRESCAELECARVAGAQRELADHAKLVGDARHGGAHVQLGRIRCIAREPEQARVEHELGRAGRRARRVVPDDACGLDAQLSKLERGQGQSQRRGSGCRRRRGLGFRCRRRRGRHAQPARAQSSVRVTLDSDACAAHDDRGDLGPSGRELEPVDAERLEGRELAISVLESDLLGACVDTLDAHRLSVSGEAQFGAQPACAEHRRDPERREVALEWAQVDRAQLHARVEFQHLRLALSAEGARERTFLEHAAGREGAGEASGAGSRRDRIEALEPDRDVVHAMFDGW